MFKKDKDSAANSSQGKTTVPFKKVFAKEVVSFSVIALLVFTFRSVFYEPFRVPTGSMIPTIMIGDFILVNKFAYGFKVPFSDVLGDPIYISEPSMPQRGDIIVFKYPKDPNINYIKRLIAVPGDEVEIVNKIVFVNGEPAISEEIDGKAIMEDMDDKFKFHNFKFNKVKLNNDSYVTQIDVDNYIKVDYSKTIIPEGQYFVMGDNRDYSADSRYWGFVPFENIKGKAMFVWFSMIFPFDDNDFKFRPWRIGTPLK